MKKLFLIALVAFLGTQGCSKCYDCTAEREYNGVKDTISTELCTASNNEVDQLEKDGYQCSPE